MPEPRGVEIAQVRTDLATWLAVGGEPWDMPASAALFVLSAHGLESNALGTLDALRAVSDECGECGGDGYHQDDSHPGNESYPCEPCGGHGRVPRRATT